MQQATIDYKCIKGGIKLYTMKKVFLVLSILFTSLFIYACESGITISFETNGGSEIADIKLTLDLDLTELEEPTRLGYIFSGWYTDSDLTNSFDSEEDVIDNITLYAMWTPVVLTVSIVIDGVTTTQSVNYGQNAIIPADPVKTGYVFTGWSHSGINITENTTITASFLIAEYTITFIVDDVTLTTRTVNYGGTLESADIPTIPEKDGKDAAWDDVDFTNITSDQTVTAVFTDKIYTVSFINKSGETILSNASFGPFEITHGTKVTEPSAADVITGYDFISFDFDFDTLITSDITINATYLPKSFSVTFRGFSGVIISTQTVLYGHAADEPAYEAPAGFTLADWDKTFNNVTSNLEVNMILTPITYLLTFDSMGGSLVDTITADYLSVVARPTNPTKPGYNFEGWYKNSSYSSESLFVFTNLSTMPLDGLTLYAKWSLATFTVSFNSNDGSIIASKNVTYTQAFGALNTPVKTGYTFSGWFANEALTGDAVISTTLYSAVVNITLYAKWSINPYTIAFNENGGTTVADITQNFNSTVSLPAAPTKVGYTFGGWYSDSGLTVPYVFTTMPSQNITLYAKWTVNSYTITFFENEGTSVTDITQNFNTALSKPSDPTKSGFTFGGWYLDELFTSVYTFALTMPAANLTLYAKWNVNAYSIIMDLDGGTGETTRELDFGDAITMPLTPVKTGYVFMGWVDSTETAYVFPATMPAEDISIKATWALQEFTLSFEENGGATLSDITQDYTTSVTEPSVSAREGYTFAGFFANEILTVTYVFTTMPASDTTVYLKWDINSYTVSYNTMGGNAMTSESFDYNTFFTNPTPTKTGYTFNGWVDSEEVIYDATTRITNTTQLFATWQVNSYTLSIIYVYETSGGTITEDQDPSVKVYGETYLPYVTLEGYDFVKYNFDGVDYTDPASVITISGNQTLTVYYEAQTFTITFTQNPTGSALVVETRTVEYNDTLTDIPALTDKALYDEMWNRTGFVNVRENIEVYALYYTSSLKRVTFMDGSTIKYIAIQETTASVEIIGATSALLSITKPGYVFNGWFDSPEFTTPIDFSLFKYNDATFTGSNFTVYAKWTALIGFAVPVVTNVTGHTITWTVAGVSGQYPTNFKIMLDGIEYSITVTGIQSGDITTYTYDMALLDIAGTHTILIKSIGDNLTTMTSAYSSAYTKITEAAPEDVVDEVAIYDYFIIETSGESKKYIFYTDMVYNFNAQYDFTITSGGTLISANANKLTTHNLTGDFTFSVDTPNGIKQYSGKVVTYINQFALGEDLSNYAASIDLGNELFLSETITPYLIGTMNDFTFDLKIMDGKGSRIEQEVTDLKYQFYLWNDSSYVLLTTTLSTYLTQNPDYSIRFKPAAEGLRFKVQIDPRYEADKVQSPTLTFEFKVNDGYNIFTDAELKSYYADFNVQVINLHGSFEATLDSNQINADGTPVNGYARPDRLGPTSDPTLKYGNVYVRMSDAIDSDNLVINGNYFTIDGSKLPFSLVTSDPDGGYTTTGFDGAFTVVSVQISIFYYNAFVEDDTNPSSEPPINNNHVAFNNLTILSNTSTPAINYSESSEEIILAEQLMSRNSGGYLAIAIRNGNSHIYNNNIGYATIAITTNSYGFQTNGDLVTTHIDNTYIHNAWANSVFGWAASLVKITESEFGSSGGAAIHVEDYRSGSGGAEDVTVDLDDATVINNWVSGQEAWFKAYGMSSMALQIKSSVDSGISALNKTIIKTITNPVTGLSTEMFNFVILTKALDHATTLVEGIQTTGSEFLLKIPKANGSILEIDQSFDFLTLGDPRVTPAGFAFAVGDLHPTAAFNAALYTLMTTYNSQVTTIAGYAAYGSPFGNSAQIVSGNVAYIAGFHNITIEQALGVVNYLLNGKTWAYSLANVGAIGQGPNERRYMEIMASIPGLGAVQMITEYYPKTAE
jgi:uncharacterized repeat protein (TIGR02543 family)